MDQTRRDAGGNPVLIKQRVKFSQIGQAQLPTLANLINHFFKRCQRHAEGCRCTDAGGLSCGKSVNINAQINDIALLNKLLQAFNNRRGETILQLVIEDQLNAEPASIVEQCRRVAGFSDTGTQIEKWPFICEAVAGYLGKRSPGRSLQTQTHIKMCIKIDDADSWHFRPFSQRPDQPLITAIRYFVPTTEDDWKMPAIQQLFKLSGKLSLRFFQGIIDTHHVASIVYRCFKVPGQRSQYLTNGQWPTGRSRPAMIPAHARITSKTDQSDARQSLRLPRCNALMPAQGSLSFIINATTPQTHIRACIHTKVLHHGKFV